MPAPLLEYDWGEGDTEKREPREKAQSSEIYCDVSGGNAQSAACDELGHINAARRRAEDVAVCLPLTRGRKTRPWMREVGV